MPTQNWRGCKIVDAYQQPVQDARHSEHGKSGWDYLAPGSKSVHVRIFVGHPGHPKIPDKQITESNILPQNEGKTAARWSIQADKGVRLNLIWLPTLPLGIVQKTQRRHVLPHCLLNKIETGDQSVLLQTQHNQG